MSVIRFLVRASAEWQELATCAEERVRAVANAVVSRGKMDTVPRPFRPLSVMRTVSLINSTGIM